MIALTRAVPPTLAACELTHITRTPIAAAVAAGQHETYERLLTSLGCTVRRVAAAPECPDSVFIEDTAVVLDKVAIVTRPGAATRRPETAAVARVLAEYRRLQYIREPGTLDGGDVLREGRTLYVGTGGRTNEDGAAQLAAIVEPFGYEVRRVYVSGCLHLKSAAVAVAPGVVLANPAWVEASVFEGQRILEIDPAEPFAANVLRVGDAIVCAAAHPRTASRLEAAGFDVRHVDVSELAKAEAGVTCCSIILNGLYGNSGT